MSFLHFVTRGLERESRDATLAEPPDWMWDAWGGGRTYTGKSVTPAKALGLAPVYACVSLLASAVGLLPLGVYRRDGRARVPYPEHVHSDLLHTRPNDEMAADRFWETVTGHLNMWGNAYLEKVTDSLGVVQEMWPIEPSKVTVERHPQTGVKRFRVAGGDRWFDDRTILHIAAFGHDTLKGLSPIGECRQTLGVVMAREEYEGVFYKNGAHISGFVKHPQVMSQPAADRLSDAISRRHADIKNAHKPLVLEEGAEWIPAGMPLRDQQFLEQAQFSVSQIARIFHVPPEMVGGTREKSSLTYSTVEGQSLYFVKFSLSRWMRRIEQALLCDKDLFPDPTGRRDIYPRFNAEGLLRGDSKTRGEFYKLMRDVGAYSPNDILELEDRPPRDGGDIYQDTPQGAAPDTAGAGADDEPTGGEQ